MGDPWARARSQASTQNLQCIWVGCCVSDVVGMSVVCWNFVSAGFPLQVAFRCCGMLRVSISFPQDGQALWAVCDGRLDFVLEGFAVVAVTVSSGPKGPSAIPAAVAPGVWFWVWTSGWRSSAPFFLCVVLPIKGREPPMFSTRVRWPGRPPSSPGLQTARVRWC